MRLKLNKLNFSEKRVLSTYPYQSTDESNIIELSIDDIDDFAKKINKGVWIIANITSYGNTERDVLFFNFFTEEYEYDATYHSEVSEVGDSNYPTLESATAALKSM